MKHYTVSIFLVFLLYFYAYNQDKPKKDNSMKLGDATQITIGVNDVHLSFRFYEKLGFKKIAGDTLPYPWMQISDGSTLILLSQDGMKYMGLTYFSKDMNKKVAELKKIGIMITRRTSNDEKVYTDIFLSPDSFGVGLIHYDPSNMYQPKGMTLLNFPKDDFAKPEKYPNPKCGIFGEFAQPVKDLKASITFWQKLGFDTLSVNKEPYPWAIMSDGMNILGLHQTKDFTYPAITYFAPDMGKRIKKLKEEGIDSIKVFEGTGGNENNVVVTTPEGQKIFLFSL